MALRKKLRSALERGTGEAYLILMNNRDIDCTKEVLYAATHSQAYDEQSEGSRAPYLYKIIKIAKNSGKITRAIRLRLLRKKNDSEALNQMCELVSLLALDGDEKARRALYKRFQKNLKETYTYCGNESILALDGIEGLLRIADLIGQILQRDPNEWEDGTRENFFQEANPDISVYERLESAAKTNINIQVYLNSIKANQELRKSNKKQELFSYATIKARIDAGSMRYVAPLIYKSLTQDDAMLLANDLLQEKDFKKMAAYLRIFRRSKFPLGYAPILEIVKHTKDNGVLFAGIDALSLFKAGEIRTLALKKLATSKYSLHYLGLFTENFNESDTSLFLSIIKKAKDKDEIHSIACSIIDIYSANPTAECKQPLELLYGKLNCAIHRCDIIAILSRNGVLSKKIKEEIKYDSYEETRNLALA